MDEFEWDELLDESVLNESLVEVANTESLRDEEEMSLNSRFPRGEKGGVVMSTVGGEAR